MQGEHELEVVGQVGQQADLGRAGVGEETVQAAVAQHIEGRVAHGPWAVAATGEGLVDHGRQVRERSGSGTASTSAASGVRPTAAAASAPSAATSANA